MLMVYYVYMQQDLEHARALAGILLHIRHWLFEGWITVYTRQIIIQYIKLILTKQTRLSNG